MMMLKMMVLTSLLQGRLAMPILLGEVKLHRKVVTQGKDPISIRIGINSEGGEELTGAEVEEIVDVAGAATRTSVAEVMDTLFRLKHNIIKHRLLAQGRFHHHSNLKERV